MPYQLILTKINHMKINYFLITVACVVMILVGISAWSTMAALGTIGIEFFLFTWHKLIFKTK